MRSVLLWAIAAFAVLPPWLGWDGDVSAWGVVGSAEIVMVLAVSVSMVSWALLSLVSRTLGPAGAALAVITGASLASPFLHVLGPTGGAAVGVAAGFAAFQFHRAALDPGRHRPLAAAAATVASVYVVLAVAALVLVPTSHVWDSGSGIGAWTGTAEGVETPMVAAWASVTTRAPLLAAAVSSLVAAALVVRRR